MKALEAALYTQLSAAATTLYGLVAARVFNRLAPQGAALPFAVYQHQAGGDVNQEQTDRLDVVYLVKGLASSLSAAQSVDEAIRTRLHNATITVAGWNLVSCMRETEFQLDEVVNGAPVFHAGASYRIRLARS